MEKEHRRTLATAEADDGDTPPARSQMCFVNLPDNDLTKAYVEDWLANPGLRPLLKSRHTSLVSDGLCVTYDVMMTQKGMRVLHQSEETRINVTLDLGWLPDLDEWRRAQLDLPTRPKAIRRILAVAIRKNGKTK